MFAGLQQINAHFGDTCVDHHGN